MLYNAVLSLALFGSAFAAPSVDITKRDLATIQSGLGNVNTALMGLDTSIKAIKGPADAQPVLDMSAKVNTAITGATTMIMGSQVLSLNDALTLSNTGMMLSTQANTTISDLVAKKAIIMMANMGPATVMALQSQKTAANGLAAAVVSKVPGIASSTAMQQTAMIGAALDMGIKAFS